MTPEEKARVIIDRQLEDAGWLVVDRDEYTTSAHACAVREGLMNFSGTNLEADYLLFIEGKAVGVVEAKREENELGDEVKEQALTYTRNLPKWCAAWFQPLPIAILANSPNAVSMAASAINAIDAAVLEVSSANPRRSLCSAMQIRNRS